MTLPQAMGSGPLAQPLFYQYKCTSGTAEPLQLLESEGFGLMLTDLDWVTASWPSLRPAWGSGLMDSRAVARGNPWRSAPLIHHLPAGRAAAPQPRENHRALCPHHSPAEGGGGCLTSATAQPWQVQDGRRRPQHLVAVAQFSGTTLNTARPYSRFSPLPCIRPSLILVR